MVEYFGKANRPVGQAAKTSASHAENMGSIPVPVTSTEKQDKSPAFSFSVLVAGTLSTPAARCPRDFTFIATPTCIKRGTRLGANRLTLDEKNGIINSPKI